MPYVSIRAEKEHTPPLLYLHGGPGDAALPLVLIQSGIGGAFYGYGVRVAQNGKALLQISWQRNHNRVLFVGSPGSDQDFIGPFPSEKSLSGWDSWGSVLGLRIIQKHPELVKT